MPRKLIISIINYKTAALTLACVNSVLEDIGNVDAEVIVVDNASGDGSAEKIERWIATQPTGTPVRLVRSETNSGFSGGHNQAFAAGQAEHYLVLNSDAVLRPGFIAAILTAADSHPDAGLIAPQIETDDGEIQVSCFRFHSPLSELIRAAATGAVTRLLRHRVVALQPPVDASQIEWASFACILMRRQMIDRIGDMDDGYFLYFEDAEYCLRAKRAGWLIAQETGAVAVHFRGGSGPVKTLEKERKRLPVYFYASRTRFLYQAHGWAGLWSANILWYLGRGIAQMRRLAGKSVPASAESEAWDLWTNITQPLAPRRQENE